ncbi:MAG: HPP family protein [Nitrososphaerales archaeon]
MTRENAKSTKTRVKEDKMIRLVSTAIALVLIIFSLDELNIGLLGPDFGSSAIIFASFSASTFILFMTPEAKAASSKRFIKSYVLGGIIGYAGFVLIGYIGLYLTSGLIIFVLSLLLWITDSEHPPGVALAFAFILYHVNYLGILVVIFGVVILVMIRILLERAGVIATQG